MNKAFTYIELLIVIIITFVVISMAGCTALLIKGGCMASQAIEQNGLKGVSEKILYGTNAPNNNQN